MDISSLGIAAVAAITVICYGAGLIAKAVPKCPDKIIPPICGAVGGVLGVACLYIPMASFPATDPVTALAVGIVSGLAATGVNQAFKQLTKGE